MLRLTLPAVIFLAILPATPAADPKVVEPFNGKDLTGWKAKDGKRSAWVVGVASYDANASPKTLVVGTPGAKNDLINNLTSRQPSSDLYTVEKFGDVLVELEFMIPQGSNSGVYLMGEYEVQVLDSYGKEKMADNDLGAIYKVAAPKVNASKKPGEWQKFVIDFQAPRFDGEKKTANGKFIKVTLNDQVIHENVEVKGQTPGGLTDKEVATGPLMFQGDHGAVAFRNIKITKK